MLSPGRITGGVVMSYSERETRVCWAEVDLVASEQGLRVCFVQVSDEK